MKTIENWDSLTNKLTVYIPFHTTDSKGRMIGALIYTSEIDMVEANEGANVYWKNKPVGHYYLYEPHASRDGVRHGAIQSTQYFTSSEDREKEIARYLKSAQARAYKKAQG